MRRRWLLGCLLLTMALALGLAQYTPRRELRVAILDVGQGDAIFISTPGGHQIIVDSGPDATAARDLGRLMPFYDRSLDLAVVTHPQADHYGGYPAILGHYHLDAFLWNGFDGGGSQYAAYKRALAAHHVTLERSDRRWSWDFGDGVRLTTLFPDAPITDTGQDPNETCIITRLEYGANSILLTGDATEQLEQTLLDRGEVRPVTVLKVAHHGSRFGTLQAFLDKLQPKIAVISVGAHNTYGHPAPSTLEKLSAAHIRTYRTDRDGTVELSSRAGELFRVKTHALGD